MIFKPLTSYILLLFIFTLHSCKSMDDDRNNSKSNNKINQPVSEEIENVELEDKIFLNNVNISYKLDDFYNPLIINYWDNKNEYKKIYSFNDFKKGYSENKPLINIFDDYKNLISLDDESNINFYNLKDFKLIKSIKLDIKLNNDLYFPTSLAKKNKKIYASYSLGKILCFDLEGNINWQIDFKDIIKTPIKIHNDNILVLLTNKIVLLDSANGEIIKEFFYKNNINQFNSSGGNLVTFNQFLFFILPNNVMGEIDTIFGEKNNSMFSDISLNNTINNFDRKLHVFNNFLFLLDQNKFLTVLDINTNEITLNQLIIDNIGSSYFMNNSIFTLKKDGFLYANNLVNNKLFWSIDLSKLIKDDDQIINISTYFNSIIIFFKDGKIIELNSVNGKIIHDEDLKLDNIKSIQYLDNYLIVDQLSGKTSIFTK